LLCVVLDWQRGPDHATTVEELTSAYKGKLEPIKAIHTRFPTVQYSSNVPIKYEQCSMKGSVFDNKCFSQ